MSDLVIVYLEEFVPADLQILHFKCSNLSNNLSLLLVADCDLLTQFLLLLC
jgi:hypothetical protein